MASPQPKPDQTGSEPIDLILGRRSAAALTGPGPTSEQLDLLLRAATTVPDHGRLQPWRFVVVRDDGRERLGEALVGALLEVEPEATAAAIDKMRGKAFLAPTMIVLVASPRPSVKVPRWEQVASAACTGYAIILAARALGLGAMWKSTTVRNGRQLGAVLGMAETEELLGWVNVGGPVGWTGPERNRPEPDLARFVTVLAGPRPEPYRPPGAGSGGEET